MSRGASAHGRRVCFVSQLRGLEPRRHWIAENIGIIPDVEVELDPEQVREGKDPQLDKAIEILMDELSKNPLPKPERPAYPDYHKKRK